MATDPKNPRESSLENPLKAKLAAGKPVIGMVLTQETPDVAAFAAASGFDFLWIEMEHSPISLQALHAIVLATRGLKAIPIARVPNTEAWLAKRVLDSGVLGVIFPFVNSPDLAREAAAACRYPPAGVRGSGADFASFRWPVPENYFDWSDRNILSVAMIEHIDAINHIEEIAATKGLDVLFVGTSDLSFSMGLRGDQNHPEVEKAVTKVLETAKRHGKYVGRPARSYDEISRHSKAGYQFLMSETDIALMRTGAKNLLREFGEG